MVLLLVFLTQLLSYYSGDLQVFGKSIQDSCQYCKAVRKAKARDSIAFFFLKKKIYFRILYEYSKDKQNVFVMYCITGTTTIANQFNIKLTKATHLEGKENKIKKVDPLLFSDTSFFL
jgi:hypothetical protein